VSDRVTLALRSSIASAKSRGKDEISADDLLLGCLFAVSRFGMARIGDWTIDLEPLGLNWMIEPPKREPKVAYSEEVVQILNHAATLARIEGSGKVGLEHILVCFAHTRDGLMGVIREKYGIDSAGWRAAAGLLPPEEKEAEPARSVSPHAHSRDQARDYLSPEEAAEFLGVHVQTLRGYIRSKKLEALRVAGERAIRIRRSSLEKLLEPN
jgi:excisionase family DNA binding protein